MDLKRAKELLTTEDHELLNKLYLGRVPTQDRIFWNHTPPNGQYSVSSGYWFHRQTPEELWKTPPMPPGKVLKDKI